MTEQAIEEPAAPAPPRPLVIARWLWILSTLVGAAHSLVQVADRRALLTKIEQLAPEMSQSELDTAANGEIMFAILISLLTFACYLLFSNRMVAGRNWARIVLTVLGGLNVLGMVLVLAIVGTLGTTVVRELTGMLVQPTDLVFGCVTLIIGGVALVLMFQREVNRYFREVPAQPRRVDTR